MSDDASDPNTDDSVTVTTTQGLGDRLGDNSRISANAGQGAPALLRAGRSDGSHGADDRFELVHAMDMRGDIRQTVGHAAAGAA